MDLETAIQAFGSAGHDLPHEVLQWTLDHWEEVAPELLGMLERYISGADRSDEAARAIFFILHLAGEKQDTRVFPLLCRLAQDGEALEAALGDDITPTLKRLLVRTYDGDLDTLTGLIEAVEAEGDIRVAALVLQLHLCCRCGPLLGACGRGGAAMSVAIWSGSLVAWERELAALKERIGPVFGRAETRETAGAFLDGLLSGVARKTGWLLAEQAGLERPYRMQSLLGRSRWDADALRDRVRADVIEALGDRDGVLVVDETGFLKKGERSVGVARQYSGTAGRIE